MENILVNFIVHHFLSANLNAVIFFNCWSLETRQYLSHMVDERLWQTRFIKVDSIDFEDNFEYHYLLHNRPILGAYLDMNCNDSERMMNTLSRWNLYTENYNWLLYDESADLVNLKRNFMNANLSVNSQLTYAFMNPTILDGTNNTSSTQFYTKYDVYNNGRFLGGKLNMTIDREIQCNSGGCVISRYLSKLHLRDKYGHRNKLHDITIRASTVVTERPIDLPAPVLLDFLASENSRDLDAIARFGFHVLLIFKDLFGCNITFTLHNKWSTTEIHGGAIGEIIMQESEMVSTGFFPTKDRLQFLTPIVKSGSYRSVCIFRTPKTSSLKGDAFLHPFSGSVWLVFSIFLVFLAFVLWLIFIVEAKHYQPNSPSYPSLLATHLVAFGAACCQGVRIVPLSMGGRIAFFSLFFITFFVYNHYTTSLLSTLLEAPPKSNIKTLGQLADSSLEVALEPLPYNYVYLNTSKLPDVRRFVRRKIELQANPEKVWIPPTEGILRVRDKPGFVYVVETSAAYPFLERVFLPNQICDLNEILLRKDRALYTHLHKNSSYKEFLRLRSIRMLESGVYKKHLSQWIKDKLNCMPTTDLVAVEWRKVATLFIMLLSAFILSLFLLGLEMFIKGAYN